MNPPIVTKELLEYLRQVFKPPTVAPGADQDKAMYQAGSLRVVDHLQSLHDQQEAP